jgi:hypothetical protein
MEDIHMKKGAVIGIIAGVVAVNFLGFGMLGAYLSKAKAASAEVREHNAKVELVNDQINTALNTKNYSVKSVSAAGDTMADYDYGYDEAEFAGEAPAVPGAGPSVSNEVNVDPAKGRLLIRTVSMSTETKTIDKVKADVESQIRELGGYIENSSMSGTGKNRDLRTIYYTIRIPADKLDSLITTVGNSCTVLSSSENTSDVTLEYVDTKARVESLRVEYDQLIKLLADAKDLDNILILQNRLTEVRYQIESAESRIRVLENQVQYATLNLQISEVLEETEIEEPHVITYGERVGEQFKDMWEGTVEFFQNFLLGLIAAIPFLVFMGIVAVIVIVIVFAVRKKKMKREAAALAEAKAEAARRADQSGKKDEKKEEAKEDQE